MLLRILADFRPLISDFLLNQATRSDGSARRERDYRPRRAKKFGDPVKRFAGAASVKYLFVVHPIEPRGAGSARKNSAGKPP
jgi:hypothetical protein